MGMSTPFNWFLVLVLGCSTDLVEGGLNSATILPRVYYVAQDFRLSDLVSPRLSILPSGLVFDVDGRGPLSDDVLMSYLSERGYSSQVLLTVAFPKQTKLDVVQRVVATIQRGGKRQNGAKGIIWVAIEDPPAQSK
jgi:hypothetical protein